MKRLFQIINFCTKLTTHILEYLKLNYVKYFLADVVDEIILEIPLE